MIAKDLEEEENYYDRVAKNTTALLCISRLKKWGISSGQIGFLKDLLVRQESFIIQLIDRYTESSEMLQLLNGLLDLLIVAEGGKYAPTRVPTIDTLSIKVGQLATATTSL